MQDTLARFKKTHKDMKELPSKACFQMNDTHPTIAVAELMRLLVDQEGLQWEAAWDITTKVRCFIFEGCCESSSRLIFVPAVAKVQSISRHSGLVRG